MVGIVRTTVVTVTWLPVRVIMWLVYVPADVRRDTEGASVWRVSDITFMPLYMYVLWYLCYPRYKVILYYNVLLYVIYLYSLNQQNKKNISIKLFIFILKQEKQFHWSTHSPLNKSKTIISQMQNQHIVGTKYKVNVKTSVSSDDEETLKYP